MKFLHEIKARVNIHFFFLVVLLIITYLYKNILLYIIIKPYLITTNKYCYFIFTDITEVLYSYITLISYIIIFFYGLMFFFTTIDFIWLGLYNYEKNKIKTITLYSCSFFFLNCILLHTYILPTSCSFFLTYNNYLDNELCFNFFFETKLKEYLSFYFKFFLNNFLISQLFIIFLVNWNFFFKTNTCIKTIKKKIYLFLIIVSTLLTPPDVFSQILISLITILVYEFFTYFYLFFNLIRQPIKTNKYSRCE
jgi:sec-independent protein translocase protein TatC